MSYDLQVWSVSPVSLPGELPQNVSWFEENGHWFHQESRWQVAVGPPDRVLPEDVPDEVQPCLPSISYLTELNLSPIAAGAAGQRLLVRTATLLARAAHGVIYDPHDNTVTTPSGVKRFVPLPSSESASLLSMSWWRVNEDLVNQANVSALIDVLQSVLPEALPRRYGLYEPPQHLYSETGRLHFEEFLIGHLHDGVVWYPHPPVADFSLGVPPYIGGTRLGFRSARMSLEVDVDLLTQPGWQAALQTAWACLSRTFRPFYGDVRTLRGYTRSRGRYYVGSDTQHHPVKSWWWRGIPAGPAHAIVVGQPYRALWPALANVSHVDDDLLFVSTEDWLSNDDVFTRIGPPPAEVTQPLYEGRYPQVWPFTAPRTEV